METGLWMPGPCGGATVSPVSIVGRSAGRPPPAMDRLRWTDCVDRLQWTLRGRAAVMSETE